MPGFQGISTGSADQPAEQAQEQSTLLYSTGRGGRVTGNMSQQKDRLQVKSQCTANIPVQL